MKVSVVIAVFNAAVHVREAVDSVLDQTGVDFEVIVIDDGSTDETAALLRDKPDPRLRLLTQENRGLVASLNRGINEATGDYIARMDGDDRCLPHRLRIQAEYLDNNPGVALVGGAISTMDEDGNPLAPRVAFPATHEEIWAAVGRRPWVFCHPAVMFRKSAAVDVGLYDPQFKHAEDAEFFARLMTRHRAVNMPEVVLAYRIRRGAISVTQKAHGVVNAGLVATIIDRWNTGEPFKATPAERAAADAAIESSSRLVTADELEGIYQCRIGRELLRGRQWRRARRHYRMAARSDPFSKMPYMGWACGLLRVGGARG
jgi:glycosyltransferase involved in cell wall biosynthesis